MQLISKILARDLFSFMGTIEGFSHHRVILQGRLAIPGSFSLLFLFFLDCWKNRNRLDEPIGICLAEVYFTNEKGTELWQKKIKRQNKTKVWVGPPLSDSNAKMDKRTVKALTGRHATQQYYPGSQETVNVKNSYRRKRNSKGEGATEA